MENNNPPSDDNLLDAKDYAALKALYTSTSGRRWKNKTGWNFTSETPPDANVVSRWHGVTVVGDRVTKIQLSQNDLSGTLPSALGDLGNLQVLDLNSNNSLRGTIPSALGNLSNLQYLQLYWTDLRGTLPSALGNLGNLRALQLFWTDLSGTLPPELGDLSNLQELRLPNNDLSGTLPSEYGDLSNLRVLRLQSNDMSGILPDSLSKLGNLQQLFLDSNFLSGTIPSSYGKLSNLQALNLSENSLSGTVPSALSELDDLKITYENNPLLDANDYAALKTFYSSTSGNNWSNQTGWNFNSDIPPSANAASDWYGVTVVNSRVTAIDLPSNSLSGTLPSELGDLGKLQALDLSENSLSGTIPEEYGDLGNLQRLDLSDNELSGTLPSELGNLQDLNLENPPYVETQIPEVYAASGDNFNLNVSAHFGDINANIASYGAEGLPDGLTIDSNSGAIGGTPTTEGNFTVTVTVEDTAGGEVEDEFNIVVSSLDSSTVGKGFPLKRGSTLLYAGDFNNDDKSDILRQERGRWDNDDSLTAQVVLSEGDGNFNPIRLPEKFVLKGDYTNLYIGDFNGDGRDDILRQEKGGWDNDDSLTAQVLLSELSEDNDSFTRIFLPESLKLKGDLTNLYIGDFDGDGQSDVLRQERGIWGNDDRTTAQILLSQDNFNNDNFNPITLPEDFALKGDFTNLYVGDFNGDGQSDIFRQEKGGWDDDDRMTAHVLLSQGDGNFTRIPLPSSFELSGDLTNLYVEDLNDDGLDEILVQKKHPFGDRSRTLRLLRSDNGENFTEHLLPSELQVNGDGGKLYIADYDGNGKNNDLLVQSFANEARLYSIDFQSILDASVDQSILNAE